MYVETSFCNKKSPFLEFFEKISRLRASKVLQIPRKKKKNRFYLFNNNNNNKKIQDNKKMTILIIIINPKSKI